MTLIATTDFICWFPIGLLGILSFFGVRIPIEWNIAITIFVLPLNAALNPFFYTFNVVLEKQRKRQEMAIMKKLLEDKGDKTDVVEYEKCVECKEDAITEIKLLLQNRILSESQVKGTL